MANSTIDTSGTSLDAHWMPFTANRAFKSAPRMLVSAKDMHYTASDGRQILDATAGMWCVNAGHCREPIVRAVQQSAATLDFAPAFQMGHPASFELASRLVAMFPPGYTHAFFGNSGSEAVDSALKIALAFHRANGATEGSRSRFVGRLRGYHGVGFGGISVGRIEPNRAAFAQQLLPRVDHLPHTHSLEHQAFSRGQPEWGAHLADALDAIIGEHGGESIAAVIVEPVAGSTGVLVPPVGYLEKLRATCDAHGILLIFDEVISGFGRVGAPFAVQRFGVLPDIVTLAKGLTNAAVPMGAVVTRRGIYDAIVGATERGIEFFHGYTYSAHPLACAAALATLDVYQAEGLFARGAELAPYWEEAVHALRGVRHVVDVRNIGLVAGIELESRTGAPGARGYEALVQAFDRGVLIRTTGDIIALSPPLIVTRAQVDELVGVVREVVGGLG